MMGLGSRHAPESSLNYSGSTFLTRLLYTTIPSKAYKAKADKNVLLSLFQHWGSDLLQLFEQGMEVMLDNRRTKLFLVPVGCKGDWPALVQMGQLTRHFGHMAKKGGAQTKGICHLCAAGMEGVPWHEFGATASWHLHQDELPKAWHPNRPSPLLCLALNPDAPETFFKIDLFHTCHKGIFADLAASAAVTILD